MTSIGAKAISMRLLISVSLLVVLVGCAVSQKNLARMTNDQLCSRYGEMRSNIFSSDAEVKSLGEEIDRRKLFPDEEWLLVNRKQIKMGMSVCALKASWGASKDNKSVGSWGTHIQHVFTCDICSVPHAYVYSENGEVTSWQKR